MTQEQAIADLKKAKDLLNLEIITQEEYDKIKAELLPTLRTGFDCPQPESKDIAECESIKEPQVTEVEKGEDVSKSSNEFITVLVVIVLIIVGVILAFIVTHFSKKEVPQNDEPVAIATTSYPKWNTPSTVSKSSSYSTPVTSTPTTEAEIAEAWSQWLKLYDELGKFKKKSDFHNYGLSSASPYHNWAKRVDDLGQTKGGKELLGRYEVSCYDLTQLAFQYISSKGKDNDYTKYIAGIVKKKTQKVVAEPKSTVVEVNNTQASGAEVIIGQWRVSNKYVKDEFDVIIKKEGSKYYAYKAGNKKEVRKDGKKYYEIGNEWGEYYYVMDDGNMKFGDEDGLVSPEVGYVIVRK